MPRKPIPWQKQEQPDFALDMRAFVTINEAARLLGITPHALRERLRRLGVPVTKIGYGSLVRRTDLARLKK